LGFLDSPDHFFDWDKPARPGRVSVREHLSLIHLSLEPASAWIVTAAGARRFLHDHESAALQMPHDPIGRYPRRECLGIMHALSAAKAAFLRRLAIASDDLIAAHWLEVEKIAKALLEEKTLSGTRGRELISRGTIVVTPAPKRRPSPTRSRLGGLPSA
jgi:hypothetical protein